MDSQRISDHLACLTVHKGDGALSITPRFSTSFSNLGVAYARLDYLEKAEEMFLQTLKVDPEHAHVHNNLGVFYLRQPRLKEAEEMFRRTLAINPGDATAKKNLQLIEKLKNP